MKIRWLAGMALFALGFACAHLMEIDAAGAGDGVMLDEGLHLAEHDDAFELIDSGSHRYLLLVTRKEGAAISEPEVRYASGSVSVTKDGLESLTVVRLVARAELSPTAHPAQRECRPDFEDCVEPDPLPAPRPPRPMIFLGPPW